MKRTLAITLGLVLTSPALLNAGDVAFDVTDSLGKPAKDRKQSIGGVSRSWIEGGTKAYGRWVFKELKADKLRKTIPLNYRFDVARSPYQSWPNSVVFEVRVSNSKRKMVARYMPVGSTPKSVAGNLSLNSHWTVSDPKTRRLVKVMLSDFVEGGRLELRVVALDPRILLGAQPSSLVMGKAKNSPKSGTKKPKRIKPEPVPTDPDRAFAQALASCKSTWKEYERCIVNVNGFQHVKRAILFADEARIHADLERNLNASLVSIRSHLKKEPNDALALRHAGILSLLLNKKKQGWALLEESAKGDKKLLSWVSFQKGAELWRRARLNKAIPHLMKALEHNPDNQHALFALLDCKALLGNIAAGEQRKARSLPKKISHDVRASHGSHRSKRTLPWLWILPVDPSIQKLTRKVRLPVREPPGF